MNENVQAEMREATRLVGLGRLLDATATIQRALARVDPDAPSSRQDARPHIPPLEGTFSVVANRAESSAESSVTGTSAGSSADAGTSGDDDTMDVSAPTRSPLAHFESLQGSTSRSGSERGCEVAAGARFLAGSYTGSTGTRRYKLYVPSSYSGRELPLLVMLHGCTQSPDDAAAGTGFNQLAEERGWLMLYPAQAQAANRQKCWNWFRAGDQQRDGGESALLAGMTHEIMATYAVDARRVYATGLSAGGAMAAVLGATHADLFAAIGVHSGLAYRAAHDFPSALAAMHGGVSSAAVQPNVRAESHAHSRAVPTIVFHGDRDTTVSPANGERVVAQCAAALSKETTLRMASISGQVPGGRAYTQRVYEDPTGAPLLEHWLIHGAGHAWSGGSSSGSYTDPKGPSAAHEMMRFFAAHPRASSQR